MFCYAHVANQFVRVLRLSDAASPEPESKGTSKSTSAIGGAGARPLYVDHKKLYDACRKMGPELFREKEFDVPSIDDFYDVPHNLPLPEVEDLGFQKSPPSALLSQFS